LGNKIRIPSMWRFIIIAAIICVFFVSFFYLPIPQKEIEWEKYQQAKICQNDLACRQTRTAVIIQSETQRSDISVPASRFSSRTLMDTEYHFKIALENAQTEFYVVTQVSVENSLFNLPNLYIPDARQKTFAEINFLQGKEIKVELWEKQVTFIFTDSIDAEWPPTKSRPDLQFAIPTANHPLIILSKARQDLLGSVIGAILILGVVIAFAVRFRKS
jgi:hypothetical protein